MKTLLYLALALAALTTATGSESTHPEQVSPPVNIAGSF